MTRRSILVVAVALLAVTAGCLGAASAQSGAAAAGPEQPTISTTGVGTVSADPDRALITVAVVARAQTADEARIQAANQVDQLRAALADAGLTDDQIQTVGYHLGPRYDREGELDEFEVSHTLQIETDDVNGAGAIVDAAVAGGANRVNGVTFTLSEERQAELRGQAIADAVAFARTDAESIASAAGVSIVGLHEASTSAGVTPVYFREAAAASDGSTTIDPGTVTFRVTVSAVYAVE